VPPAWVVERLKVVEDGELGLASGLEPAARLLVEQLTLQRREQALGQRVIEAVGDAAHAREGSVPAQFTLEGVRGVFPAAVAVVNHARDVPAAALHGHRGGVDDQVGLAVTGHRPAQHHTAEHVPYEAFTAGMPAVDLAIPLAGCVVGAGGNYLTCGFSFFDFPTTAETGSSTFAAGL
jgi:hypothetical protein